MRGQVSNQGAKRTAFGNVKATWLSATWLALVMAAVANASAPPDSTFATRQAAVLRQVATGHHPFTNYAANPAPGNRVDCQNLARDSFGLLAAMELRKRNIDSSIDDKTFPEEAAHIAKGLAAVGNGRCHFSNSGTPATAQAYAALGYLLLKHGSGWSSTVRAAFVSASTVSPYGPNAYLVNANIDLAVGRMLFGEALNNASLYASGETMMKSIADETFAHGGREIHSPLYTAQHFAPLVFGTELANARGRALSRILLDYELLVEAHQDLPALGLMAPQSRDYSGGAADPTTGLAPTVWAFTGDPLASPNLAGGYYFTIAGALNYKLPAALRDIFLDKTAGYTFWSRSVAAQGSTPTKKYAFGELVNGHRYVSPQATVVLPGGEGGFGLQFGWDGQTIGVSSGAYLRTPTGFAILYHQQPLVTGDTGDTGVLLSGAGLDADPDDFVSELYDHERMLHGRTGLSLWDPRARSGVVRTYPETRARVPDYASLGGQTVRRGAWRVAKLGQSYIGYYPFSEGTIVETARTGSTDLRLPGRSGFVIEMATASEFPTLAAYADDLAQRNVVVSISPLSVEVSAFVPGSTARPRIRLEYLGQRRFVDGTEKPLTALDQGLLSSPWVRVDRATRKVTVARGCQPTLVYDWDDATVQETTTSCSKPSPPVALVVR